MAPKQLPLKTRCLDCHRLQTLAAFSKKQQDSLKKSLGSGRIRSTEEAAGEWIVCQSCTARSRSELQCSLCNVVKGLDGFSKAQRRNNDSAVSVDLLREGNLQADDITTDV